MDQSEGCLEDVDQPFFLAMNLLHDTPFREVCSLIITLFVGLGSSSTSEVLDLLSTIDALIKAVSTRVDEFEIHYLGLTDSLNLRRQNLEERWRTLVGDADDTTMMTKVAEAMEKDAEETVGIMKQKMEVAEAECQGAKNSLIAVREAGFASAVVTSLIAAP